MKPLLTTAALSMFALTMFAMPTPTAQAGCLKGDKCCKKACCPKCSHECQTCKLEAELVDVEKKCFEVETKTICIPRVVFPWQKKQSSCHSCKGRGCTNCVHNGAKIRTVKVLKSKKYKCPECEYTWTPEEGSACCSSNGGCGDRCGNNCGCGKTDCDSGCCDSGCDSGMLFMAPQPMVSEPMVSQPMVSEQPLYESSDQHYGDQYSPMPAEDYGSALSPVEVQPAH
ncbi:hypothetical protein LF1_22580 [Rubripirellula obstinata]|uniref:Stigma-specific protein, Stig1 n=1 Tax=Rubripirellula obstinata TaxID=406547 RepID=A0A5B1CHN2_9BACT|nr:hypothetical protein [Rubripirellula obstinata]KAA1259721.1 hypothetical protein LF1_22580 [Rubripirellula obstinata]